MVIDILILGFGKTGKSCLNYFNKHGKICKVFDTRCESEFSDTHLYKKNEIYFSEIPKNILESINQVVISPGFDSGHEIIQAIKGNNIEIVTDIDIFKSLYNHEIISITGTNGKTTVVSMLEKVLNDAGKSAIACGNNGLPPLDLPHFDFDYVILELSSYQLEYMKNFKTKIGVLLNISSDHLERHESISAYTKIKKNIFNNADIKIADYKLKDNFLDDEVSFFHFDAETMQSKIYNNVFDSVTIKSDHIVYDTLSLKYRGSHDLRNIFAVLSVANALQIDIAVSIKALSNFIYPPHRIELIKVSKNISWYNDSKSTNCDSTYWALKYLSQNIILIMGGSKKIQDYSSLSNVIEDTVKLLILVGNNAAEIKNQLKISTKILEAENFREAVDIANNTAEENDSVILSPASPSFDRFNNYQQRGEAFKQAVIDYAD